MDKELTEHYARTEEARAKGVPNLWDFHETFRNGHAKVLGYKLREDHGNADDLHLQGVVKDTIELSCRQIYVFIGRCVNPSLKHSALHMNPSEDIMGSIKLFYQEGILAHLSIVIPDTVSLVDVPLEGPDEKMWNFDERFQESLTKPSEQFISCHNGGIRHLWQIREGKKRKFKLSDEIAGTVVSDYNEKDEPTLLLLEGDAKRPKTLGRIWEIIKQF